LGERVGGFYVDLRAAIELRYWHLMPPSCKLGKTGKGPT